MDERAFRLAAMKKQQTVIVMGFGKIFPVAERRHIVRFGVIIAAQPEQSVTKVAMHLSGIGRYFGCQTVMRHGLIQFASGLI